MKRRIVIWALLLLLVMPMGGMAEEIFYGDMRVVNCREWVSLREVPGTGGRQLAKIPLGAMVEDAEWVPLYDQYICCRYNGRYGYVLKKYLAPDEESWKERLLLQLRKGLVASVVKGMSGETEIMEAVCRELGGAVKWTYRIETDVITELEPMAAFVGGARDDPRLMLYCSGQGLKALDWRTGEVVWSLGERLGASISWDVADDGTMYIGGYYGPDPVCVGNDGEVIWRSHSGSDEIYWLTEIEIGQSGLGAFYDVFPESETGGWVVYDWDGTVKKYKGGN